MWFCSIAFNSVTVGLHNISVVLCCAFCVPYVLHVHHCWLLIINDLKVNGTKLNSDKGLKLLSFYECLHLTGFLVGKFMIERFSYDLEMKMCEQNWNKKQTEIERFDWFIEWIQTCVAFGLLSECLGEKNFVPKNFLEINWYFALTSTCNTIGQLNNAFSILGFSLVGKWIGHVLIFSSIG